MSALTTAFGFIAAHWRLALGGVGVVAAAGFAGAAISRCGAPSAAERAAEVRAAHESGRTTGQAEGRAAAREEVARALEGTAAQLEHRAAESGAELLQSREREAARLDAGRDDTVPEILQDLRGLGIEVLP